MGLCIPDDSALIGCQPAWLTRPAGCQRAEIVERAGGPLAESGWQPDILLVLNPKAFTLLPRHEHPRSVEAVEKLVRNLSERENCQFCWETPSVQTVTSEQNLRLDER